MIRRITPAVIALALSAVSVTGCVSLFPKAKPATLYRLAPTVAPPSSRPLPPVRVNVLKAPIYFTRTSASDLIVTTEGNEAASIKGVRWATPVQLMFDEALTAAFDGDSSVNLIGRGAVVPPDLNLRIEVTRFEADYADGAGSAPTVKVAARLSFTPLKDPTGAWETVVRSEVKASDNRVGPIVEAYNAATGDVLAKIVAETDRRAALIRKP